MKVSAYSDYVPNNKLSPQEIFKLINRSLATINPELQNHNEKTTFLALSMASYFEQTLHLPQLYYLSMFHSIGFYRYNPDFHSESIFDHKYHDNFIYGFYYLKYMTPLNDHARVIRCFDGGYEQLEPSDRVYAKIIFGAGDAAGGTPKASKSAEDIVISSLFISCHIQGPPSRRASPPLSQDSRPSP